MRKVTYFAVFEPSEDGGYSVYFPDLPGCVSFGEDFKAAIKGAEEALGLHLYGMEKDGEEIPVPAEAPMVDPDTAAGYLVAPVSVFPDMVKDELDNKRVKTTLTLPAWLKEAAEHSAMGINYSRVLETALKDILGIARR